MYCWGCGFCWKYQHFFPSSESYISLAARILCLIFVNATYYFKCGLQREMLVFRDVDGPALFLNDLSGS
jgi:hypothetical protein